MQRRINITGRSTFSVLRYRSAELGAVESASADVPWPVRRVRAGTGANADSEDVGANPGFPSHEGAFGELDLRWNVLAVRPRPGCPELGGRRTYGT